MDNQNNNKEQVSIQAIAQAITETMKAGAWVQKDKGRLEYKAEIHRSLAAYSMAKVMEKFGLKADAGTLRQLLAMVDNHSAWRRRLENAGIFPRKDQRPIGAQVDDYLAELEEEGA